MDTSRIEYCVFNPNDIPNVWDILVPHIQVVLNGAHGESSLDTIYNNAIQGKMILMSVFTENEILAVFVLRLIIFDTGKRALSVDGVGSAFAKRLDEWLPEAHTHIKEIAKFYKCEELRGCYSRKGWFKKVPQAKPVYEIVIYPLNEELS